MSVFQKIMVDTEQFLDELVEELLYETFEEKLTFEISNDGADPLIHFYFDEEDETPFFTIIYDEREKELYFWESVFFGDSELTAKIYIESMEELTSVVNELLCNH